MKRQGIFFLSVLFCLSFSVLMGRGWAEFYGQAPTGLLELERKYPYYLFVPPEYTPEKGWPLVVLLSRTGEEPEEIAKQWVDWAKKNQLLLLVGSVFPREGSIPEETDRWWIRVKQEVIERYHVASSQILLVGIENADFYAAYLGIRYPEEFSAAALFRRASPGAYDKLIKISSNPMKQIPFYMAVDPAATSYPATEAWAAELEKKGYPVVLETLKTDEDFFTHRDRMIQWFLQDVEARVTRHKPKTKDSWKKTLQEMRKNMFGK